MAWALVGAVGALGARLAAGPVTITGDPGGCPRPADVEGELAALSPADGLTAPSDVVELRTEGSATVLILRRPNGELVAERTLAESLSCAQRARVVAVILAAWTALRPPPAPPPPMVPAPLPTA